MYRIRSYSQDSSFSADMDLERVGSGDLKAGRGSCPDASSFSGRRGNSVAVLSGAGSRVGGGAGRFSPHSGLGLV